MQNTSSRVEIERVGEGLPSRFSTGSVRSRDGTTIGFRRYGRGPAVILVQGAMGVAQHFDGLATAISQQFTTFVPDRRGRGMSPRAFTQDHTIDRDVDDVEALVAETGAERVFGLSSGAIIALEAAARGVPIKKLALFEPPLFETRALPVGELAVFDDAIGRGDDATALAAAGKAVALVPMLNVMPMWLLVFLTKKVMAAEAKNPPGNGPTMRQIAPTLQYDLRIVAGARGSLERWKEVDVDVLHMGGDKSPTYLKGDLDALGRSLRHVHRVTFAGLDHGGSWDRMRAAIRKATQRPSEELSVLLWFEYVDRLTGKSEINAPLT